MCSGAPDSDPAEVFVGGTCSRRPYVETRNRLSCKSFGIDHSKRCQRRAMVVYRSMPEYFDPRIDSMAPTSPLSILQGIK